MGEEIRGQPSLLNWLALMSDVSNILFRRYIIQDMKAKYEQSKKELDDLVEKMETI